MLWGVMFSICDGQEREQYYKKQASVSRFHEVITNMEKISMNQQIIYGSEYGTTRRYAEQLSQLTGIPAMD